jgi:hypothetical protein
MAIIDVRIFSLIANARIELFTEAGEPRGLDLAFAGSSDTARGEDELYRACVPAGKYFLISPCSDGSINLSRVTARDGAGPITELVCKGGRPMKDQDVAAFAGTCRRERLPETVAKAFLARLERSATQDYLRPSSPPAAGTTDRKATDDDYTSRARRH